MTADLSGIDIGATAEAKRIATIQDNLNVRQAALGHAINARSTSPVRDLEDAENLLAVTNAIEDYIRGTDLPRGG